MKAFLTKVFYMILAALCIAIVAGTILYILSLVGF